MSFVIQHNGKPVRVSWRPDAARRFAVYQHARQLDANADVHLSWTDTGKLMAGTLVDDGQPARWTGWEVLQVDALKAWGAR